MRLVTADVTFGDPLVTIFEDPTFNNLPDENIDKINLTYGGEPYEITKEKFAEWKNVRTYYINDSGTLYHYDLSLYADGFSIVGADEDYAVAMAAFNVDHPVYVYEGGRWTTDHFQGTLEGDKPRVWKDGNTSHTSSLYTSHDIVLPKYVP